MRSSRIYEKRYLKQRPLCSFFPAILSNLHAVKPLDRPVNKGPDDMLPWQCHYVAKRGNSRQRAQGTVVVSQRTAQWIVRYSRSLWVSLPPSPHLLELGNSEVGRWRKTGTSLSNPNSVMMATYLGRQRKGRQMKKEDERCILHVDLFSSFAVQCSALQLGMCGGILILLSVPLSFVRFSLDCFSQQRF